MIFFKTTSLSVIAFLLLVQMTLSASKDNSTTSFESVTQKGKKSKSTSTQCKGYAKSTKARCKKMTTNSSGYCKVHGG